MNYLAAAGIGMADNCSSALEGAECSAAESKGGVSVGAVSSRTSLYTDLRTELQLIIVLEALVLTISAL